MADTATGRDLRLLVMTPSRKLADATVEEVQVPSTEGLLGILAQHAPLVTRLGFGVLTYSKQGVISYLAIEGGVAEVRDNVVTVLADAAEEATSIDAARAQRALARARERLQSKEEGIDVDRALRAEARAQARLDAAALLSITRR